MWHLLVATLLGLEVCGQIDRCFLTRMNRLTKRLDSLAIRQKAQNNSYGFIIDECSILMDCCGHLVEMTSITPRNRVSVTNRVQRCLLENGTFPEAWNYWPFKSNVHRDGCGGILWRRQRRLKRPKVLDYNATRYLLANKLSVSTLWRSRFVSDRSMPFARCSISTLMTSMSSPFERLWLTRLTVPSKNVGHLRYKQPEHNPKEMSISRKYFNEQWRRKSNIEKHEPHQWFSTWKGMSQTFCQRSFQVVWIFVDQCGKPKVVILPLWTQSEMDLRSMNW